MKRKNVKYKDINTTFIPINSKKIVEMHGKVYCALCTKQIMNEDGNLYLLINNFKLFPNVLVHLKCCKKNDKDTIRHLTKSYEESKRYRVWWTQ